MQRYLDDRIHRIPSACGVTGIMDLTGKPFTGNDIILSICNMLERGNGLGAGYAGYGIYPDFKNNYCFHVMYDDEKSVSDAEQYIFKYFDLVHKEPIPTKFVKTLRSIPVLLRYFLNPKIDLLILPDDRSKTIKEVEEDFIVKHVMFVNKEIKGAFIFSSGKDMGIFKGVGNPDEIGEFFKIKDYKGYIWTAHNRFPTNSVAWWGGAHPFGILNWSVVHNGEISSYGINRRYLENFEYFCTLSTDTEVIVYLLDLLIRKHRLSFEDACSVLAAPFWSQIGRMDEKEKDYHTKLRMIYGSALLNGPFGIIVATNDRMMGLTDRIKLRPLVAGQKGNRLFIASEEAAIRTVEKDLDRIWMPDSGKPVMGVLKTKG